MINVKTRRAVTKMKVLFLHEIKTLFNLEAHCYRYVMEFLGTLILYVYI
mgnify:CR=1 FL=1